MANRFNDYKVFGLYTSQMGYKFYGSDLNKMLTYSRDIVSSAIFINTDQLGLFPLAGPHQMIEDPQWIQRHKDKIVEDIKSLVPESYEGLVCIDYNKWHPNFDWSNYDSVNGYFYEDNVDCFKIDFSDTKNSNYKEDFYNWHYCNDKDFINNLYDSGINNLDSYMKNKWNDISKTFFLSTIQKCKELRPKAKWSFANLPTRIYKDARLNGGGPGVLAYGKSSVIDVKSKIANNLAQQINNDLSWLYNEMDVIMPFINSSYYTVPNSRVPNASYNENSIYDDKEFLKSIIKESLRMGYILEKPVVPVIYHQYNNKTPPYDLTMLNDINISNSIRISFDEGSYGVAFYASLYNDSQISDINYQYSEVINPILEEILTPKINRYAFLNNEKSEQIENFGDSSSVLSEVNRNPGRIYLLWNDRYLSNNSQYGDFADFWKKVDSVDLLLQKMNKDYDLGYRRFILWLPGGGIKDQIASPNQWLTIVESKRNDLAEKLNSWLSSHDDSSLGVYAGALINPDISRLTAHSVIPESSVFYDVNNPLHMEYFRQNWGSWLNDIGIDSLFFHYGSNDLYKDKMIELSNVLWTFGIKASGVGLPIDSNENPDNYYIQEIPWIIKYDDFTSLMGNNNWLFNTSNTEIGVILTPDMSISKKDIDEAIIRGLVLWAIEGWYDSYIFESSSSSVSSNKAEYEIVNEAGSDPIEGFGISRYDEPIARFVGDKIDIDYADFEVLCIANSVDGTFEFKNDLSKKTKIQVDIINPSIKNASLPHWVIEDTFEWVNSGMPSHLSQVSHSNLVMMGINLQKTNPDLMNNNVPPYQANFIVPCDQSWYDKTNSTLDYNLKFDYGNRNITLPYPNCVKYIQNKEQIWIGGLGGLVAISTVSKRIDKIEIDSRRDLFIKDIFIYDNIVYILDKNNLYLYNLDDDSIELDTSYNLPKDLYKIVVAYNKNIVIGSSDGLYARKITQDSWTKVLETSDPIDILISPDALFAVSNGIFYYSVDGLIWVRIGEMSNKFVNQVIKHRSNMFIGTDAGIYDDGGSMYASSLSVSLVNYLDDLNESSSVVVNDVASNFDKLCFATNSSYIVSYDSSGFTTSESLLSTIHKIILVDSDVWVFGYDEFQILSESFIRKLASGEIIK